jgi:hypothetical protein
MNKWLWLALLPTIFASQIISGDEKQSTAESIEEAKTVFILPINWAEKGHINLVTKIPEGFQTIQPMSEWENASLIEFIPKGESADNWSEIISVHKLIGQQISAEKLVESLKNAFLTKTKNGKVWSSEASKESSYEVAHLIISYELNGKQEVFGCIYYSGPYELCRSAIHRSSKNWGIT